jgi:hypothetical protein
MANWWYVFSCWRRQESRWRVLFDVEWIGRVDNLGLCLTGRDGGGRDGVLIVSGRRRRDRIIAVAWLNSRLRLLNERKL